MGHTKTSTGRTGPFHNEIFNVAYAVRFMRHNLSNMYLSVHQTFLAKLFPFQASLGSQIPQASLGSQIPQPTPPTTTSTISSSTSSTLSSPSLTPSTVPPNLIHILQTYREHLTVSVHSSNPGLQALLDSVVPQGTQFPISLAMLAAGSIPSNPVQPLSERQKQSGCQPFIRTLLSFLLEKPHLTSSYFIGRTQDVHTIMETVAVEEATKQFESSQQYASLVRQHAANKAALQASAAVTQPTAPTTSISNVSAPVSSQNNLLLMSNARANAIPQPQNSVSSSIQPQALAAMPDWLIQELKKYNVVVKPIEAPQEESQKQEAAPIQV